MAGIRQTPNSNVQTTTITYPSQATGSTPQLQIINSPGGGKGQVQFHSGNGSFSGDSNFIWNKQNRTMSILGNIRISENIIGKYYTNLTNFKITGGNSGQVLSTNGSGNLSWVDQISPANYGNSNVANYLPTYTGNVSANYFIGNGSQLTGLPTQYSNSNVANYLPTYTGNLNGSNLIISNTGYIYNISSTGSASLTTANVSANLTANAIYTDNYFYANGSPYSGGGSELVNGNNSFVLDSDGNVVFEGNIAGQAVDRGLVWDYGANANGVNSMVRQDNNGLTVRAYTTDGGGANGYSAPVNIVTSQDDNTKEWVFDGDGNLTLPGNLRLPSGNIVSGDVTPTFNSAITGITTGNATVIITLVDAPFNGPTQGQVTISGVTGTTEANDTWYYEAAGEDEFQLYTDDTFTTPVDGTTWTTYISGGDAVSIGTYSDLSIQGGNVSVNSNNNTWAFGTDGNLTVPGAIKSSGTLVYRGFYASVNQISELNDDPSINQIVLSQSSSISGANLTNDTNDDNFTVSDLGSSYNTAIINLYGADFNNPIPFSDIQSFVQTYIDTVLYDGETLRTSVADVQTAFATNEATLIASVPEGTLYNLNFNAIQTVFETNAYPNTGEGTGAVFYFNFDDVPNGTFDYSSMDWNDNEVIVPGTGYAINDVITIPGTEFGGTTPDNDMEITVTAITVGGGIDSFNMAGTMSQATYEQCFVKHFIYDGEDDAYDTGNYIGTNRSQCVFNATTNADGELVVSAVASGSLLPFQTFHTESDGYVMVLWQKSGATEGGAGTYIVNDIESDLTEATYTSNGIYYAIDDVVTGSNYWNGADYGGMVSTTAGIFSIVALDGNVTTVNYLGETGADGDGEKTAYSKFALGTAPLTLEAGYNIWTFDTTGSTIFPTLTVTRGDRTGTLTGQTLLFGDSTQEALISTPNGTNDINDSQRLVINPGAGAANTSGEGGDIYLYAGRGGDAGGSGGDIKIRGGLGPVDGNGGYLDIQGGDTQGNGTGGYIDIRGGESGNAAGGAVNVYGGYGPTVGGNVNITGGQSGNGISNYGNVSISSGASTWTFNNTGNLELPSGGIIYETSIPGGELNGNTIVLKPQGGTNADQQLLVYPTTIGSDFNHLHLTSGNLYNTELFLGSDDLYVKLANTGNIVLNANDNTGNSAQWTFGANGIITVPGPISGLGYSKLDFTTYGSNTVYLTTTNDDSTALFMGSATAELYANTNVSIRANTGGTSQEWIFDDAGNLTLPGNTFAVNYANGTQVSISGGSSSSSNISNGNSNVSIATANGNVTINAVGNNVVTITGTGANITGTANITGNVTPGNITFSSNTGQIVFGTGAFISGNANSLTRDGSILLQPYTGAGSTFPGVIIGGAGRLLAPNGGVFQIFNASDVTFQVAIKSTLSTAATSTTTGALIIPGGAGLAGSITTGIGALLTGPTFTPLANTMAGFVSNVNSYTQLTIQNKSTGADATTDFIATADNGTDTINYADFGIINSGYDANTPTNSLGNIVSAADTYLYAQGNVSNTNQSGGNLAIGTTIAGKSVKIFAGGVTNNSIIATISNTGVAVNGNVTATNFSGNISITGNVIGTTPNVTLVAGSYSTVFANTGVATFPGNISTTGNFVGNGAALTNVAVSTTGTWTVATGINTYNITVPINGNYQLWVRGNIPNGIITYQATVSVTNTNVPVLGTQRAWNYTGGGSPILLTTMPTQIVGAEGTISTTVVSTTTANRFDFIINNSSGSSQTIYWGYVTL